MRMLFLCPSKGKGMNPPERVRQWRLSAERGSDHKQQPHFPHCFPQPQLGMQDHAQEAK